MVGGRELSWRRAAGAPSLDDEAVHIWRLALDRPAPERAAARALLSPDERSRADRFVFDRDRDHFTIARAGLRRVLGGYLGCSAERIRLRYGAHGKPALDAGSSQLTFNLSHAHAVALVAISRARAVGIDVEWQRVVDVENLATHNFSTREQVELFALPTARRLEGFFRCWTRKEAYIKARGEGLSMALDGFTVSLDAGPEVSLASDDPAEDARWWLRTLPIDPGYVAALAVEGAPGELRLWDELTPAPEAAAS